MSLFLAIAVLAGATPAPGLQQASFRYPDQVHGTVHAGLEVGVADRLHVPGLAGATLTTCVQGGPGLEVQPVQLSESVAWKVQGRASAWTTDGEHQSVCELILLDQSRPGPASLPAVTVRFRADAQQRWSKAEWSNPLGEEPEVPPPEGQEDPPSPWLRRLAVAAGVTVGSLLALGAWRLARRRPPLPSLSAQEKALQELAALRYTPLPPDAEWAAQHTRLVDVLRRYLAGRLNIAALEQSSVELLTAVGQRWETSDPVLPLLRRFLSVCDRARFAPRAGSPEDFHQALDLGQSIIEQVETLLRQAGPSAPSSQAPQS